MKTVYIERNKLFNFPMILCNNVTEVDEDFIENNTEIFYSPCEVCDGTGVKGGKPCDECEDGQIATDPYQYYIARLDEWEEARLKEYGVTIGHSEALDLSVIPIYDYGTSWSAFSYSKEVPDDYTLSYDETEKRETVY